MMDEDLSGTTVGGRFRFEERLGDGSMGAVYRARDNASGDVVAVKVMHGFVQKSASFRERFEQEALALRRLEDPRCVRLIESGVDEPTGKYFMAVEFAQGEDLLHWRGQLELQECIEVALQIAKALVAAHSAGILHRDLKPENIKLAKTGEVISLKVLDFGLAKVIDIDPTEDMTTTSRRRHLTKAGELLGTPQYMAPELCEHGGEPTPATDLYALGLLFYEMIEGRPAFDGRSPLEILSKQMTEPAPPLSKPVPTDVTKLIAWTLQKNPNDRPQAAEQVVEILSRLRLPVESAPPKRGLGLPVLVLSVFVVVVLVVWGLR